MKCPIDQTDLVIADRQGIEIDYCPKCRGVWLDRGELDKVIERTSDYGPRATAAVGERSPYTTRQDDDDDWDDDDRRRPGSEHYGKKRRRKSLLGELFDF